MTAPIQAFDERQSGDVSAAALRILRALSRGRSDYGMCLCSIDAGLSEYDLASLLAQLLSRGLVEVVVPHDAYRNELALSTAAARELKAECERLGTAIAWFGFFRDVDQLDPMPRYYVRITREGRSAMVRGTRRLARAARSNLWTALIQEPIVEWLHRLGIVRA